jgi:hypothetical protein
MSGNRCQLSNLSIRDLQMWRKLASAEIDRLPTDGRSIRLLPINVVMHTDAADVGFHGPMGVACYALLRMRPLSISCAECSVVISCGKVDYDKFG